MNKIHQALQDFLSRVPAGSLRDLDDVQMLTEQFMAMQNHQGLDDFEGLSPAQMRQALDGVEGFDGFRLHREQRLGDAMLEGVPLIAMYRDLAQRLQVKPIKLTPKGRWPRAVFMPLHDIKNSLIADDPYSEWVPRLEDDCPAVTSARVIFEELRWVRIVRGQLTLTRLGKTLAQPDQADNLFWTLFEFVIGRFNWGYNDRYDANPHIQHTFVFCVWLLAKNAGWQTMGQFLQRYHRAFPSLVQQDLAALAIRMTRVWQWMGVLRVKFNRTPADYAGSQDQLQLTALGRALYGVYRPEIKPVP
ncbi:MAG: hypothetical protein WA983_11325 [Castellaniella sp.]|uniref:hypothetical protein n=1 Tax=Castellaniella sp. TaxID=1955812 RepID=UPI003C753B6B